MQATWLRRIVAVPALAAMTLGAVSLLSPTASAGKGGPPGGGIPPDCPCDPVLEAPGLTCVLTSCVEYIPGGFLCGYTCNFPF